MQKDALKQIQNICDEISDLSMENGTAPNVDIKITTVREAVQEDIPGLVPAYSRTHAKYVDKTTISVSVDGGKTTQIHLPPVETDMGYYYVPLQRDKFPQLEEN